MAVTAHPLEIYGMFEMDHNQAFDHTTNIVPENARASVQGYRKVFSMQFCNMNVSRKSRRFGCVFVSLAILPCGLEVDEAAIGYVAARYSSDGWL